MFYLDLQRLAGQGRVSELFPARWFDEMAEATSGLGRLPERHPYAPERGEWPGDVRNVLLNSGYRILFEVHGDTVWVMRVRHQRQLRIEGPAPGTHVPPDSG